MSASPLETLAVNPNAELYSVIAESVDRSLADVSETRQLDPSTTHSQRVCGHVSDDIIDDMSRLGHNVFRDRRIASVDIEYDDAGTPLPLDKQTGFAYVHYYVKFMGPETPWDQIIVDATWQQFIPEAQRTEDLPKALIGTRREVHSTLLGLGFTDQNLLKIWDPQ